MFCDFLLCLIGTIYRLKIWHGRLYVSIHTLTLDYSDYSDVCIHESDGDKDSVEDTFVDTGVENCNKPDNVRIT